MNDYIELSVKINPFYPWADVVSQELADIGFDSFRQEDLRNPGC